jgi:hypothetical protein
VYSLEYTNITKIFFLQHHGIVIKRVIKRITITTIITKTGIKEGIILLTKIRITITKQ